jgi:hypothetical protein
VSGYHNGLSPSKKLFYNIQNTYKKVISVIIIKKSKQYCKLEFVELVTRLKHSVPPFNLDVFNSTLGFTG